MIRDNTTVAVEDYLKTIYALTSETGRASTNQIADRMGVTPASVTGMIKKMAAAHPPLVAYQKHHGVVLTSEGETVALEIIRHHRLLELFLQETLGFPWDQVHSEADRLEHVISEDLEERIAQALGYPLRDPHGEPIPAKDFSLPPQSTLRLLDLPTGQRVRVQRVEEADDKLLRYLASIGLVPQAELTVFEHSEFDENLRLQVTGQPETIVLGPQVTHLIFVEI